MPKVLFYLSLFVAAVLLCARASTAKLQTVQAADTTTMAALNWDGVYQVTSNCMEDCCCLSGFFLLNRQDESSATLSGQITGGCTGPVTLPIQNFESGKTYHRFVAGEPISILKEGIDIYFNNLKNMQCSVTARCVVGGCMTP